jgi:hypothetical protein
LVGRNLLKLIVVLANSQPDLSIIQEAESGAGGVLRATRGIFGIEWNSVSNWGIRVVMPKKPKVVPIQKPPSPATSSPAGPPSLGVLRDQIIVRIGPVVFAVDYAVKVTELKVVTRDASGRIISMRKSVEPPSDKPDSPA